MRTFTESSFSPFLSLENSLAVPFLSRENSWDTCKSMGRDSSGAVIYTIHKVILLYITIPMNNVCYCTYILLYITIPIYYCILLYPYITIYYCILPILLYITIDGDVYEERPARMGAKSLPRLLSASIPLLQAPNDQSSALMQALPTVVMLNYLNHFFLQFKLFYLGNL